MKSEFDVRYTDSARDVLLRLFNFLLDRAQTVEDFDAAQLAIDTITSEVEGHLGRAPFIFRKTGQSPFLRELVIPFRNAGCVVLYEIEDGSTINILAVRHQLEDDYH
jgi:plasmid stabilization system protein ParE